MTFKLPALNQPSSEILALSYYFPTRTPEHPKDLLSQAIVHIENKGEIRLPETQNIQAHNSIEFFAKTLTTILGTKADFMLAMAPPSKAAHHESDGMKFLIDRTCDLMPESNIKNRAWLLERHKDIESSREGAIRTEVQHRGTFRVKADYRAEVQGKIILLLDDVTLTGNTMKACRRTLMDAGAKQVTCLTLGQSKKQGVIAHPSKAQIILLQALLSKGEWPSELQEGKHAVDLFQSNFERAGLQKAVEESQPQSIFAPIAPTKKREAPDNDENSAASTSTPTPQEKKPKKIIKQLHGQLPLGKFFKKTSSKPPIEKHTPLRSLK